MNQLFVILVIFLLFANSSQAEKPFVLWPNSNVKAEKTIQTSQSCFLQKNLPQHIDFVLKKILPRIEREAHFF